MDTYIRYEHLESGVHKLTWLSHTREAIQEFVDITKTILDDFPPNSQALILQDFRHSAIPSFRMLLDAIAKSGSRNDVQLRVAYIADDGSLPLIVNSLTISKQINGNRSYFKPDQEQDAIKWLLNDD